MKKKPQNFFRTIFMVIVLAILGTLIWLGYRVNWTGFNYTLEYAGQKSGKYLWDWLELLIIPLIIASLGFWFSYSQKKYELEIAAKERKLRKEISNDQMKERTLQSYLREMRGLILHKGLDNPDPTSLVRGMARSITLTSIRSLDPDRIHIILKFLQEANLINRNGTKIDISGITLKGLNFREDFLQNLNLHGVTFYNCDFFKANLGDSDLSSALIMGCNLKSAVLRGTILNYTKFPNSDLSFADLTNVSGGNTDFSYSILFETICLRAKLPNSEYFQAQLTQTKFIEADITRANFTQALLYDVNFTDAKLTDIWTTRSANVVNSPPFETNYEFPDPIIVAKKLKKRKSLLRRIRKNLLFYFFSHYWSPDMQYGPAINRRIWHLADKILEDRSDPINDWWY